MKKKFLVFGLTALSVGFSNYVNAQSFTTSGTAAGNLVTDGATTGNVGINTNTPLDKFSVNGNIGYNPSASSHRELIGRSNLGLSMHANTDWGNGGSVLLNGNNSLTSQSSVSLIAGTNGGLHDAAIAFSKWNGTAAVNHMVINNQGNTTIGTGVPAYGKLTVGGTLSLYEGATTAYRSIMGKTNDAGLAIYANDAWSDGSGILLNSNGSATRPGSVTLVASGNGTPNDIAYSFAKWNYAATPARWDDMVTVRNDGKMVVGNGLNTPNGYKLFVQEGILTEKVKVALSSSAQWADFVFAEDYSLKPLDEVEAYINEHNHLPEIPSADEMVECGLDVAQMDAKLLQKIEELTLYIINQQKQIDELKSKMNK